MSTNHATTEEPRRNNNAAMSNHNDATSSEGTTVSGHHHRFTQYDNHTNNNTKNSEHEQHTAALHRRPSVKFRSYLTRKSTQARIDMPVNSSAYVCGLLAGVTQAGIFNPYDRALYLSVKENRSFLAWQNWQSPYNGFFQSIGGRALSGGLYFPLEHYFLHIIAPRDHGSSNHTMSASYSPQHFVAGTAAGAANAVVLNPLSAIKYKSWGRETSRGMWAEALGMVHKAGGFRPFWNGLLPTVYRDVVFGGCYTYWRFEIQRWGDFEQWQANCLAAAMATIASGPFNYVRNVQYGTRSKDRALSTWMILRDLYGETLQQESLRRQVGLVLSRLRIGWGTARVALGMSLGHSVYDLLHDQWSKLSSLV